MFRQYDFSPKKATERVFVLGVLTVLILMGTHSPVFSLGAFVISSLIIVFDKSNFKLMLMTYLMLMAHIFKISATGMSYFTFLMLLYIGIKLIDEKNVLWSAVFFILYIITVQFIRSEFHFTDDLKLAGNILFIGYSLSEICSFSENEKDTLCITYVAAVIVSSLMRFFDSDFFRISSYTSAMITEGFGEGSEEIVRFSGLYDDPNYYTVNLIMSLCLIALLYYKNKIPKGYCAIAVVTILYLGTLTYSKSFILMLMIPFILFLYANHKIGRYDIQIISIALVALMIVMLLLINPSFITGMQKRLESGSSVTTGRSDIWLGYLDHIYRHPDIALFGAGIGADLWNDLAIHNVYIEILYHLGLFGGALLIFTIINSGIIHRTKEHRSLFNRSLMIVIIIMYSFLSQLHDYEFPIHFMLMYMVLYMWNADPESSENTAPVCLPLLPDLRENSVRTLKPTEVE